MSWYLDVLAFHKKFGQTIGQDKGMPHALSERMADHPTRPDLEEAFFAENRLIAFRLSLIEEELQELKEAIRKGDRLETADALCDLIYVVIGTAVAFAMDLRPVWKEVQRSNMAKDGGGTRGDGKILKPLGWKPPDIETALASGEDPHTAKVEYEDTIG